MLIRLLVISICAILVAFAYVTRKPLCVDSSILNRIDLVNQEKSSVLYKCSLHRHVPFDENLAQLAPLFGARTQLLERFLDWAGALKAPINLTVAENRTSLFRVYDHEVYLGGDLATAPGLIERAILKVWMRERASRVIIERTLIEEILTDFFLNIALGTIEGTDPNYPTKIKAESFGKWPRVLRTMSGYCTSPWKFAEHIQFCQQMNSASQSSGSPTTTAVSAVVPIGATPSSSIQLTSASLRPLLSSAMIGAFRRMGNENQFKLAQKMASNLNVFYFKEPATLRSLKDTREQSLQLAAQFVVGFAQALSNWKADDFLFVNFAQLFLSELELRGFSEFGESSTVQYYVLGDYVNQDTFENLQTFVESSGDATVAIEKGEDLFMLPNTEAVPKTTFGFIRSKRAIWLKCQMPPQPSDILIMANRFDRILAVDVCDLNTKLDLVSYVKGGASDFAKKNKNIPFVHINTKSFALAIEKKMNPYSWTNLKFIKNIHAYKAENVIPSIDYFRGRPENSN